MSSAALLNQLRGELSRRRLPPHYIARAVREIEGHCEDIASERQDSEAASEATLCRRLGDPVRLAADMASEFRAQHFAGRHPWLVFLGAPLPCTMALAAVWYFIGFCVLEAVGALVPQARANTAAIVLVQCFCVGGVAVPLLGVTMIFARWALRAGCGLRWVCAACVLQCLLGASVHTNLTLPTAPGKGSFSIGLGVPPANLAMLLLPCACAAAVAWRYLRQSQSLPWEMPR